MKILYVATDRHAAELAAYALRNIAHDVKVSWAESHSAAFHWAESNRDADALIFEADSDDPACAVFVGRLREQGLTAPVFAVTPDRDGAPPAMLGTGPDDYVVSSKSLLADLPDIVRRGLQRAQNRDTLSQKLRDTETALEQLRRQHAADAAAAAERFRRREAELGTALDEAIAFRSALEFRVTVLETARQNAERQAAAEQAAAVDLQAGLEARLLREASTREILERKIAEAEAARRETEKRHSAELTAAAKNLADRQARFEAGIAAAGAARDALEQKLAEAQAAIERSEEQRESDAAAAASAFARRKAEYAANLGEVASARDALAHQLSNTATELDEARRLRSAEAEAAADDLARRDKDIASLERQLADIEAARQIANERGAADRAAAAQREKELEERLAQVGATRSTLEQKLANLEKAHQEAFERFTSELKTAASLVAERQAAFDAAALQATAAQSSLEQQLRDAATALERSRQERAEEGVAAAARRAELERQLAEVEAARERADERATVELAAAARRESDLETRLTQAADTRSDLEQQLHDRHAAYEQSQKERTEEAAAAAEARAALEQRLADNDAAHQSATERAAVELAQLAQRHGDLEVRLELAAETGTGLERQLRESQAAHEQAQKERREEAAAAARHLAHRETELGALLTEAGEARTALERRLAESETAHQSARERATIELAEAAQRQGDLEVRLELAATTRLTLEQQLRDNEATLEKVRQERAEESAAAARHLAQRETAIAEAVEIRTTLERRLAETEDARRNAEGRATTDRAAAAQRQAELEARLEDAAAARAALEQRLADMETAHREADERYRSEISGAEAQLAETQAEYAARLLQAIGARDAVEQQLRTTTTALERVGLERDSLKQSFEASQDQTRQLDQALSEEREGRYRERMAAEDEQLKQAVEYAELQRILDEVRADYEAVTRLAGEHVAEAGRLGTLLTERDIQLQQLTDSHRASEQAATDALAAIESKLHAALEAGKAEAGMMLAEIKGLKRDLEVTTKERDGLQAKADRLPHLQSQLDDSRAEIRRLLEHSPYGICRVMRDGSIVRVNRALLRLVGCKTAEELRAHDLATNVFPSADDLRWLIERCLTTDAKESIETTWKRKDGRRRIIRLLAFAAPGESVELIVEDITDLRTTEEKLVQAQRMEAVGRLASEVAVTCNHLLRDVSEDGHQWLNAITSDSALRQRGELLLGEVTRAASFLQQIAAYGEQQTSALEPVNVNEVLRGLQPVLQRVAGDDIAFVLQKAPRPINVDVAAERVERILVNVAGYARQRMPHGGRLKIDVARVTVDGKFLAKYPNVRPGAHALITVTEEHSQTASQSVDRTAGAGAHSDSHTADKPGVDVGVLLELVGDCGGHLWMAAEPDGNLVLKIHLPQRVSDGLADPQTPATRPVEERATGRWFGH